MTIVANISRRPLLPLLLALSGAHLLNDLIASMIPAMYPLLKEAYQLDFTQIGLITLAFHVTSSLLQPVLGYVTDHKPWAYAMVAGMASTLHWGRRARIREQLRDGARLGGAGRARLGRLPSGSHAHGASCGGRPARALPRAYFRSAGMSDTRLGRCSPRWSSSRAGRRASPGCRSSRSWRWC